MSPYILVKVSEGVYKVKSKIILSVVFESKYIGSVGYGSMACDNNNVWSFGGPGDEWSVWVAEIYWWRLGLAIDRT